MTPRVDARDAQAVLVHACNIMRARIRIRCEMMAGTAPDEGAAGGCGGAGLSQGPPVGALQLAAAMAGLAARLDTSRLSM